MKKKAIKPKSFYYKIIYSNIDLDPDNLYKYTNFVTIFNLYELVRY